MFIVDKSPRSIPAENYRTLRTNIKYSIFDNELKAILVTSSEPGEGKSTTAGNLALSFAQDEKKTIIIDCDLRRPTLHKRFQISGQNGLSEVIVEKRFEKDKRKKCVYEYNEYLDVMPAGKIPPNPSEMLSSKIMGELIDRLKEEYDYIIIDSPPVHAVTDAQVLSTKVDGVLLVVRAGKTKKESVIAAKESLEKVNAKIIGSVLNGVEQSDDKYYHYYG
ncbi:CpsD/CapB family tyrosine-protein kinase [uncultured Clostridium sp.]|uniref:CpsD/CapB family tyrosine-protein kinase n=1 Tax=uncultured Clostridium sp. TaxID=59620 RepID=UPI00261F7474|nr:CpsD/CapB family tyrosine-protein kinase [uncultured Clostridium sp.]